MAANGTDLQFHGGLKELSQQTHRFQKPSYGPNFTEKCGADKIKDLFTSIWFSCRFLNPNIFFSNLNDNCSEGLDRFEKPPRTS